jgi:hypothetical protein
MVVARIGETIFADIQNLELEHSLKGKRYFTKFLNKRNLRGGTLSVKRNLAPSNADIGPCELDIIDEKEFEIRSFVDIKFFDIEKEKQGILLEVPHTALRTDTEYLFAGKEII